MPTEQNKDGDFHRIANPRPDPMDPPAENARAKPTDTDTDAQNPERGEGLSASWSLEADRVATADPLVESLRILAGHYGRRTSAASLTAGLPLGKEAITPALFARAAERAGLHARLVERDLESLAMTPNMPCLLVLKNGQSCIVWKVRKGGGKTPPRGEPSKDAPRGFLVQFPETPDEKKYLAFEKLDALYTGYAFFVRPIARQDERAGPPEIETRRDWFWPALIENKALYAEALLAAVIINLLALSGSIFIMTVYDRVIPNNATDTLWVLSVGVTIAFVFDFILKNLRAQFLDHAGKRADIRISARLFSQIMGMTLAGRPASAGVLASNMREFETLRDFFTSATMVALIDLPFTLFFIVVIAWIGGPVALVPLLALPLVIGAGLVLQKPLQRIIRDSMNESALKNALLFETITGLETIKVQAAEGHTQRSWEELSEKAAGTGVKARRISAWALNWAVFVQQMVSVGVVIVGVHLITAGDLKMGALIACVILSGRAMAPLAQVAGLITRLGQSRQALAQLTELMKRPVERPAGRHFISMQQVAGKIEFRDVVFHYPDQTVPALDHVSFTIPPGAHVGLIGAVGSGKTTIERLLLNLYQPGSGAVLLDGTDVRQIDPGDLRRSIGAVQQSPQLFFGSVRSNITMGHETAPERAVLAAAEMAGVMDFLRESQAGLDTQVGERGEALSGGQRQAVAVARALLYDPPVLILDEPTASMDPASEHRLRLRLEKLIAGRTTLLITHKGAMLSLVDQLILIDRGRVVAYGAKDEVIAKLQARQYGTQAEKTDA